MSTNPLTIPTFLASAVERRGDEPSLGTIRDGQLRWRSWREIHDDAQTLAATLRIAGVSPGDRVAQISENRYKWILADLAMHLVGAVHVPIHVSLSGPQIAEQIGESGARLVFVSNITLMAKFADLLTHGETILIHNEQDYGERKPPLHNGSKPPIAGELRLAGEAKTLAAGNASTSENSLATILFTSGTTGRPRGVMLSQRNLASNAAAVSEAYGGGAEQTRLCVLPLSHIYARTCDLYTWLYRGSRLVLGESRETLLRDCQLAQPTVLNGVPYMFQRIADRVRASGAADEAAALAFVFGGQMLQLACGGAAIAPEIEAWYAACGLPVSPGYGLSEASPVITVSTRDAQRLGTVGRPIGGVEVRIAADGEVLVRGPNVMLGYWQDEEATDGAATAEAIRDGWLHTGDLGSLDADGFLTIRGRKKELIALSTGKKVSPTRVEALLTASPLIEQVAVFGEGRPGLTALVVSSACGLAPNSAELRESLAAEIKRCLTPAAHEEQVRDFVVLDRPFSIERGELTPKMSLCRAVIERNFAEELKTI
jgi:long-chain acyl-CoA synthetase